MNDRCISNSHLPPLETFDPQVEDFLYSSNIAAIDAILGYLEIDENNKISLQRQSEFKEITPKNQHPCTQKRRDSAIERREGRL